MLKVLAAIADLLDEQGLQKEADIVDEAIQKIAARKKKRGRGYRGWIRELKKMDAPKSVIERFEKQYKGALEYGKKNPEKIKEKPYGDTPEEYAMRTALDRLPDKYKEEPGKGEEEKD